MRGDQNHSFPEKSLERGYRVFGPHISRFYSCVFYCISRNTTFCMVFDKHVLSREEVCLTTCHDRLVFHPPGQKCDQGAAWSLLCLVVLATSSSFLSKPDLQNRLPPLCTPSCCSTTLYPDIDDKIKMRSENRDLFYEFWVFDVWPPNLKNIAFNSRGKKTFFEETTRLTCQILQFICSSRTSIESVFLLFWALFTSDI